ncbi:glycoside hydrolase superfamily [Aspergillus granulosus]|uniref:beta-glucosidase n=1 Tax=Aspergillus granulosus TaxID=176169 RepID=A0ABR4H735_9EURO
MLSAPTSAQDWSSVVQAMTLEEKCSLLAGANFWHTAAIERLKIPSIKVTDGPNGARGEKFFDSVPSACVPAAVSLAASWNLDLLEAIGKELAEETKAKGAQALLGPTVCPHRHPLGGRNFESYSEDPFLAGHLASRFIKGLQANGVGATIKHYAVNEQETLRNTIDAQVSERALREIYLRPFEIAIRDANPWGVMTSYNSVNGAHADMNEFLLNQVLRVEWGFQGLTMSDWGGTNSTAESLNAGLDLEMPGPSHWRTPERVKSALESGELSSQTLDERVTTVLSSVARTKSFEEPQPTCEERSVDSPERRAIIRNAGAEGIVLLKNREGLLPLQPSRCKSIALLGLAKEYLGHGGGSASVNSQHKITPFDAIKETCGDVCDLRYAPGVRTARSLPIFAKSVTTPSGERGLEVRVEFTDSTPSQTSVQPSAGFQPIELRNVDTATITGIYTPEQSGAHYFSCSIFGEFELSINDKVILRGEESEDIMGAIIGVTKPFMAQYNFETGQEYRFQIRAKAGDCSKSGFTILGQSFLGFKVGFMHQQEYESELLPEAIELATSSDLAIVFTGHTPEWETEGVDRETLALPKDGNQDRLVSAVAAVNQNTIVVNCTGSPIDMPWLPKVAAVIQAWFPGQEAGYSITDVLLGHVNPGGKLPVTFPKTLADCPANKNFPGDLVKRVVEYEEGIYIGYRHYDRHPESVLFPFGFGLSYTKFTVDANVGISNSNVIDVAAPFNVSVTVKNIGPVKGSEVIQLYVRPPTESTADRPQKELAGFAKIELEAGTEGSIEMAILPRALAYWDNDAKIWSIEAGEYMLLIGTSSAEIHAVAKITVPQALQISPNAPR